MWRGGGRGGSRARPGGEPKARAMVDIAQHADGELSLSYRGKALSFRRFACHDHLHRPRSADAKTVDTRVDPLRKQQRDRLARLKAELSYQDSQRAAGVYRPDTPPIVPPRGAGGRYGLRPSQPPAPRP